MTDQTEIAGKVFGVSGSPRRKGNSDILLEEVLRGVAESGVPERFLNLTSIDFKGCIGCEKCRKDKVCTGIKDDMTLLYDEIIQSKGLVAVCPTHNYNVTSWMKAFIDRLYCFYNFENDRPRSWSSQLAGQGRKAVVIAICEQEDPKDMGFTIEAMTEPLAALGYDIVGELAVYRIFDKGKVREDKASLAEAFRLGERLAKEIM